MGKDRFSQYYFGNANNGDPFGCHGTALPTGGSGSDCNGGIINVELDNQTVVNSEPWTSPTQVVNDNGLINATSLDESEDSLGKPYGESKPKRIIIRGELTGDKDKA